MYRFAASRLRPLKGQACFWQTERSASTSSVAARPPITTSMFRWLTGEHSSVLPPLNLPLSGTKLPPPLPDYVEPGKTKITTLSNGFRIASETAPSPCASIGLYVDCGSIYEKPHSLGVTQLLERMAFKSTTNRSHLCLVRERESIGASMHVSGSREQMAYTLDALKTYVPTMVELLIDSVRNPAFLDWEVNEQLEIVKADIQEFYKNPQAVLMEAIHMAGFQGALSNPLIAPESSLNQLNSSVLEEFVAENYTASRMVLSASGVEHEELLSLARPLVSDLPKVPHPEEPKSDYVGGDWRNPNDSDGTHVALAFEVPGGWHNEKEAVIMTVLQMLMGGGGSFSAGGPGKGMHSRLYLRVLNKHQEMQNCSAFSSTYNNTGVFGIFSSTDAGFVSKAVDIAAEELLSIAKPGQVKQIELDRAKKSTKSAILMNLESRMIAQEDIGRQILTYGERKPLEDFLKALDEITLEDITSISEKIISSPLTVAAFGEVSSIQSYETISSKFHST